MYAVTTSTGRFVLRTQGANRGAWSQAIALQRLASDAGIAPELVAVADTITEMVKVRHAYDQGIRARRGIDF